MIKITRDLVLAVKEMMERWNVVEIAAKMNLDPTDVQMIVDLINNIAT
jgi:hypothetical protein